MRHVGRASLGCHLAIGLAMVLAGPAVAFEAAISIDPAAAGRPVNRMLLGNNVQWVDLGDGLLSATGTPQGPQFDAARALAPSTLRYPGGSQADTYHWRDGVGPSRGKNRHFFSGEMQRVAFGTDEFLSLCALLDAKPLLSVNVASGTPAEAAEWVGYVNAPSRPPQRAALPRVEWWEIGNEPYLKPDNHADLAMRPEEFARRATAFITAMKAADPTIKVGLPLRSDVIGGRPATPYPGFNEIVLRDTHAAFDFVAVHNAYAPAVFEGRYGDRDLYLATMAAPLQVAEELEVNRVLLRRILGHPLPLAITEYSTLFTLGGSADDYVASLTGGLYIADLLRVLAQQDDVMAAHYWSIAGNWHFGTVSQTGRLRPAHLVLSALSRAMHGQVLPATVTAPALTTPAVGYVAVRHDVVALTALALRDGATLTVIAVNKHPDEPAAVRLEVAGAATATVETLSAPGPFDGRDGQKPLAWARGRADMGAPAIAVSLPPHSVSVVSVQLR